MELNDTVSSLQRALVEVRNERNQLLDEKNEEVSNLVQEQEQHLAKAHKEMTEARHERDGLLAQIQSMNKEMAGWRQRMGHAETEAERSREHAHSLQTSLSEMERQLVEMKSDAEIRLDEASREVRKYAETAEAFTREREASQKIKAQLEARCRAAEESESEGWLEAKAERVTASQLREELSVAQTEAVALQKRVERHEETLAWLRDEVKRLRKLETKQEKVRVSQDNSSAALEARVASSFHKETVEMKDKAPSALVEQPRLEQIHHAEKKAVLQKGSSQHDASTVAQSHAQQDTHHLQDSVLTEQVQAQTGHHLQHSVRTEQAQAQTGHQQTAHRLQDNVPTEQVQAQIVHRQIVHRLQGSVPTEQERLKPTDDMSVASSDPVQHRTQSTQSPEPSPSVSSITPNKRGGLQSAVLSDETLQIIRRLGLTDEDLRQDTAKALRMRSAH